MVLGKLRQIGQGFWAADGDTQRLRTPEAPRLELWRTKWSKAGRVVFEVAPDFSEAAGGWREMLRVWVRAPLLPV
jgi:hypothetical protein